MSNQVRVVLKMSELSVPDKINKAEMVLGNLTADPVAFPVSGSLLTDLDAAITALRNAAIEAADGGKSKVALMHAKEKDLVDMMRQVGVYVEKLTKADAGRAAQAGLELRQGNSPQVPEFEVKTGAAPGSVRLRTRPQNGVFYKWQYSTVTTGAWVDAFVGNLSRTVISGLAPGFYWFRVVLVDATSQHELPPRRVVVN